MSTAVPRTVTSPKKFIIGKGLLSQMHEYVHDFGDNAFIIADEFILSRLENEALTGLEQNGINNQLEKFNYECSEVEMSPFKA